MAIIRVEKNKENPYVTINKTALNDTKLSFKAKGIFAYLMSRPDDWKCQVNDLKNHAKDGRDSIYAGLKELREHGYMIKRPIKNEKNIIVEWEEVLYETPQEEAKEIFKTQQETNEKATLKRAETMRKKKNKDPLTENPDMVAKDEESTYGKSGNGKSESGKSGNIINNKILNTDLLTNEISSSSSKEEQFNYLLNLYSEHYGVITNGRKRKLYNYFAESDFNFEFMKGLIEYITDQRATKHSYFDKTIEALFEKGIKSLDGFVKSIQDHYKNLKNNNSKPQNQNNNSKNNKTKSKASNFTRIPSREYNYEILERRLLGEKVEDLAKEYGITVEEVIDMSQPIY